MAGQLPATPSSEGEDSEPSFDQGKSRVNAQLATAGHSGQNGKKIGRAGLEPATKGL